MKTKMNCMMNDSHLNKCEAGDIYYLPHFENHIPVCVKRYICLFCNENYAVLYQSETNESCETICDDYVIRRIKKEKNPELIIAFVEELYKNKEDAEKALRGEFL